MLRRRLLRLRHARRRHYSSSYSSPASVHLSSPTFAVYGANTGVGKTLVSAGLAASLLRIPAASPSAVLYLKPLQTGFPADSDAAFVFRRVPALLRPSHPARLVASQVRWRLAACLLEGEELGNGEGEVWKLVETAGGAASPGPSGTLQCDLYRLSRENHGNTSKNYTSVTHG